jgi:6-phosphofructokinase
VEARVTTLGHVQRGGQATWDDRLIASSFGVRAVDLVAQGEFDRMVA